MAYPFDDPAYDTTSTLPAAPKAPPAFVPQFKFQALPTPAMTGADAQAPSLPDLPAIPAGPAAPPKPKDRPFFSPSDVGGALWEGATQQLVPGIKSAAAQLYAGMARPDQQPDWAKRWMTEGRTAVDQSQARRAELDASGKGSSIGQAIREAVPSLGFSLGSMAASLPAGIAAGALTANPLVGFGAAGAAGGAAGYRMAGASLLNDTFAQMEAESIKARGHGLTEDEKAKAYEALLPVAQNTGLWEAGPEAVGNAVSFGLGGIALKFLPKSMLSQIGASAAGKALLQPAGRLAAATGAVGTELATEGITQYAQGTDQAKADSLVEAMREGTDLRAAMDATPKQYDGVEGLIQATKDVAPATLATVGLMGLGAKGVQVAANRVERIANDRSAGDRLEGVSQAADLIAENPTDVPPEIMDQARRVLEAIKGMENVSASVKEQADAVSAKLDETVKVRDAALVGDLQAAAKADSARRKAAIDADLAAAKAQAEQEKAKATSDYGPATEGAIADAKARIQSGELLPQNPRTDRQRLGELASQANLSSRQRAIAESEAKIRERNIQNTGSSLLRDLLGPERTTPDAMQATPASRETPEETLSRLMGASSTAENVPFGRIAPTGPISESASQLVPEKANEEMRQTQTEVTPASQAKITPASSVAVNDQTQTAAEPATQTEQPVQAEKLTQQETPPDARAMQERAQRLANKSGIKNPSMNFSSGVSAFDRNLPRELPSYFTDKTHKNAKDWLKGWDAANESAARPERPETPPESNSENIAPSETVAQINEVSINDLSLSEDVPQFKSGANRQGVVEPLGGKFDRTGVAPIIVWERADGRKEVISGRHRLDLARRSGETTIPAQIVREADGFDARQAANLDAELNIRDGQGSVKDYVQYFQNKRFTQEEADLRGLVSRRIGQTAFQIATNGNPELIAAHRAGRLSDDAAESIARAAPGDTRLQALGIKAVAEGKSASHAANLIEAVKAMAAARGKPAEASNDLFGFDDSALKEAAQMADIATRRQRQASERLAAIQGASKRPDVARKEGVNVKDEAKLKARIDEIKAERNAWNNWSTHPELVAEIGRELRGETKDAVKIQGASQNDGGSRPRSGVRQESRNPDGRGKRVQPIRRKIGNPQEGQQGPGTGAQEQVAPSPAPAPAGYGADNKVFTKDAADKAREILKRKLGQLSSGIDPEILQAGITLAGYHIEAGARKFSDYAKAMIADLGEAARPFLRSWYEGVRYYPGIDTAGMTGASEIESATNEKTSEGKKDEPVTDQGQRSGMGEVDQEGSEAGDGGRDRTATQRGPDQGNAGGVEGKSPKNVAKTKGRNTGKATRNRASGPVLEGVSDQQAGGTTKVGRQGTSSELADDGAGRRPGDDRPDGGTVDRAPVTTYPNYRIDDPKKLVGGTPKARFAKNKLAIETYNELKESGLQPTPEQLDAMASYTGWGSFGQELFQGNWHFKRPKIGWEAEDAWLRDHLGKGEWESAQSSILNAHYTDPPTVQAMWAMAQKMGFNGGRVLEPSMGIGNFFGLMPSELAANSQLTGIELDEMTAGMAKLLYPDATIRRMGYQDSKTSDDFYDLVIGNWPFAKRGPVDRRYMRLSPSLHDYFFLKALDQVRPGGLVIGITSRFTMDKKGQGIRRELAKKGELVASFRLPSGAFEDYAGTGVVTDIIVLRKRDAILENPTDPWIEVAPFNGSEKVSINRHYLDHPGDVLGESKIGSGTTYGTPEMIVVRQPDFAKKLAGLADKVKEGEYRPRTTQETKTYLTAEVKDRQQSVIVRDDKLYRVEGDRYELVGDGTSYKVKDAKQTAARKAQIESLIGMRRQISALFAAERDSSVGDAAVEAKRAELKKAYESFVTDHGPINESFGLKYLDKLGDPYAAELSALESSENGIWKPATALSEPTTRGKKKLGTLSVSDALVVARNESMMVDPNRIAELAKTKPAKAIEELTSAGAIFETPQGAYEATDVYLSGNVRRKLREAKAALEEGNAGMARNVAALEKVIPKDVPYYNIEARLGATWIPADAYSKFFKELAGGSETDHDPAVRYVNGQWKVDDSPTLFRPETGKWSTPNMTFRRVLNYAMNVKTAKIYVKLSDGSTVVDEAATKLANQKIADVREEFSSWVWKTPDRQVALERTYNEIMNAIAAPKYDGSFLKFEGMALKRGKDQFSLRQHQVDAIYRGLVNKRGVYAHEVGTGKTLTIAGIAVESRRYGIARKPLVLAHNANAKQVAEGIKEAYPGAKVLYINNLDRDTIDAKLRQIKMDDWDAVVVPHSLIDRFALSKDTLNALAKDQIDALEEEAFAAAREDNVSEGDVEAAFSGDPKALGKLRSATAKDLVRARNTIVAKIDEQAARASKEGAVTFEELGVDQLIVDEFHSFKKPPLETKMAMRGLNKQASGRSISLNFLAGYVKSLNGGTGVHLFSGTPITNTLNETFHFMRYIMDNDMKRDGISSWDAWFNNFASETNDIEVSSSGQYEPVTRLGSFINVADLRRMLGNDLDIVFADDMPEFAPRKTFSGKTMADALSETEQTELLNGRSENPVGRPYKKIVVDSADMTPEQAEIMALLVERSKRFKAATGKERMEIMKSGSPESPILVETDAANAGLDQRLFKDGGIRVYKNGSPNSKASRAVANALKHFREHPRATQVIFMERGINKDQGFGLAQSIRDDLIAGGIPENQVVLVSDATSDERKLQIAEAMNRAEIRVVIGSTQKLGVGVNMQENLRAMHHLDAPWTPADLEQRNGRGHRQGNKWNTVYEYRYLTERIDARRWQVLAVKDRFIKDFLKADENTRVIESDATDESAGGDIVETLSTAAGDPRILIATKLKADIEKLKSRERMHGQAIVQANKDIETLTERGRYLKNEKADAESDYDAWKKDREGGFSAEIDGKRFDNRTDAQAAMDEFVKRKVEPTSVLLPVGKVNGQAIAYRWSGAQASPPAFFSGNQSQRFMGKATIASAEGALNAIPKRLENIDFELKSNASSIENMKAMASEKFGRADELEKKQARLKAVEKDMAKNPVPPPPWLRNGAPVDSTAFHDGKEYAVSGHRWTPLNYVVELQTKDGKTQIQVPYDEVKDAQGIPLYEQHPFAPPVAGQPTKAAAPASNDVANFEADPRFWSQETAQGSALARYEPMGYEAMPEAETKPLRAAMAALRAESPAMAALLDSVERFYVIGSKKVGALGAWSFAAREFGLKPWSSFVESAKARGTTPEKLLRHTIYHELGHGLDSVGGRTKNEVSSTEGSAYEVKAVDPFALDLDADGIPNPRKEDVGPLLWELWQAHQSGELEAEHGLSYPMRTLPDALMANAFSPGSRDAREQIAQLGREAFAQAHAVWWANREAAERLLPQHAKLFEEVYRGGPEEQNVYATGGRLQDEIRARFPAGGRAGGGGSRHADSLSGNRATDAGTRQAVLAGSRLDIGEFSPEAAAKKTLSGTRRFLDRLKNPLSGLPELQKYMAERYLTQGRIATARDETRAVYDLFAKAPPAVAKQVFEYLTTPGARVESITDPNWRADAQKLKRRIDQVGKELVDNGYLSEGAYQKYKDQYLPRLYLRHLLKDNEVASFTSTGRKPDMSWAKSRKDIPEEVRRLVLGEIRDPAYLAAHGLGTELRDIALLDWLGTISKNQKWTLPDSLVDWNGQKVTPFWLASEAKQIRAQTVHYAAPDRQEALEMAQKMEDLANRTTGYREDVPDGYKRIPDGPRYGKLRGMVVRKEIFDDIVGSTSMVTDASLAERILGDKGAVARGVSLWKWAKVAANVPAQVRNFVGNGVLLQLSGVNFAMVPVRMVQAFNEIRANGPSYQIAKQYGVTESTFSNQELRRIDTDFTDSLSRQGQLTAGQKARLLFDKIYNFTGDLYQFSETMFKTASIIDSMAKGKSAEDAALQAQNALYDYSLVSPSVRYLRNAPLGAPFITFMSKSLPMLVDTALHHPIRFAPYVALPYIMAGLLADQWDLTDEDVKSLQTNLPKWLREKGHAYILPTKDDAGRWQAVDLGYFFPWTTFSDIGTKLAQGKLGEAITTAGILGSPVISIATAIQTGVDPFTDKPIFDPHDPPSYQAAAIFKYAWSQAMPTFLTDVGAAGKIIDAAGGRVDKYGQPTVTTTQAVARLFGVNLYPINPDLTRAQNLVGMRSELAKTKARMMLAVRDPSLKMDQRQTILEAYRSEIEARMREIEEYATSSRITPAMRVKAVAG